MFELQRLPIKINTEPPAKKELIGIIKKMKNGKSANDIQIEYIKHSLDCKEFLNELVDLYRTTYGQLKQFQKNGDTLNLSLYGKVRVKEKRTTRKHTEEYK